MRDGRAFGKYRWLGELRCWSCSKPKANNWDCLVDEVEKAKSCRTCSKRGVKCNWTKESETVAKEKKRKRKAGQGVDDRPTKKARIALSEAAEKEAGSSRRAAEPRSRELLRDISYKLDKMIDLLGDVKMAVSKQSSTPSTKKARPRTSDGESIDSDDSGSERSEVSLTTQSTESSSEERVVDSPVAEYSALREESGPASGEVGEGRPVSGEEEPEKAEAEGEGEGK